MYRYLRWDYRNGDLSYGVGVGVVVTGWSIRMDGDRCSLILLQWFGNSVSIAIKRVER